MINRGMCQIVSACLIVLISVTWAKPAHDIPQYIECVDSSDCARDECCTIGLGRFTIPVCRRMLELDEQCHPDREAFNTSVSYPDGNDVILTNVYINFCPCQNHLTCDSPSGTCTDPSETMDFNYVDNNDDYAVRIDY